MKNTWFGQYITQINWHLFVRKPQFLLRVFYHFIANIFNAKSSRLRTMTITINSECNCRCEHCFAESMQPAQLATPKLNLHEMCAAIKEMVNNGVYHFCLQGGETFLHPDLDKIIKACQPRRSFITLVTNGTIADKEMLKTFMKMGVDKIAISIDSYFSDEHDKFRNLTGCYYKAMQTMRDALDIGLEVSVAVTVMNDTLHTDSVQKIFNMTEELGINIDINIPQPVGKWDGRIDILLNDGNFRYINNLHNDNIKIRRDLYPHIGRQGCPAVKESLHMNLFGDIYPCVYTHISLGNIRNFSLKDIRANGLLVHEYSTYASKCLSGEDMNFIQKYISQGFSKHKPTDGNLVFQLSPPPLRQTPLTIEK